MTATVFLRSGTAYDPTSEVNLDVHNLLPGGNYMIKQKPMNGPLYFDKIASFPDLGKVYGDATANAARIMQTFESRNGATGVLLNGEKGSGKTMMAKSLSKMGEAKGYPTIIINQPWCGDAFNQLMQSVQQPCIVLFDEFEKVYDREQQQAMLTLLDGVFPSKKLFILTCNDKYRVDDHMRNRPGRIFYLLDFAGLDANFIRDYCNDKLNAKEHIEQLVRIASMFDAFNFDMLKAVVEEMNRYEESPQQALRMLNAKPQTGNGRYVVESMIVNGRDIVENDMSDTEFGGSPIAHNELNIGYWWQTNDKFVGKGDTVDHKDDKDEPEYKVCTVRQADLKQVDADKGTFTYQNKDFVVVFARKKYATMNYYEY